MADRVKINSSQLWWLMVTNVTATAILFVPAITTLKAGQDAWLVVSLVATVTGIIMALLYAALGTRFPGENLIEYCVTLWGWFVGKLVGLGYIVFFIQITALIVREFGDFLVTAFMPETPIEVFNLVLVILAASAVRNGIEVIARMNQFIFPLAALVFLLIIALGIPGWQVANLLPILEKGWIPVLEASPVPVFWRSEIFLSLMIFPFLNQPREARGALIKAVVLIGLILTLDILAVVTTFGPELTSHFVFPTFNLARYISLAGFVERLEAGVMVIWVAGVMVKVAIWYYCAVLAAARWLNLRDYKVVVLPIGVVLIYLSLFLFHNTREMVEFIDNILPYYGLVFTFLIPLLLFITALMRRKGGSQVDEKNSVPDNNPKSPA